jgi:membrane-associated phospholipid phosphatase
MSGMSGMSGMAALVPESLVLSRAAIVGPYAGATLQTKEPPFDKPGNLALWADGPRITACFTELVEGLLFDTDAGRKQATLAHASLRGGRLQSKRLVTLRAPRKAQFKKQAELVAAYADLRPDRAAEIVAQVGFPVPFWASVIGLHEHRHKKTLQLLDLAYSLAVHVQMRFKQIFATPRPEVFSPQIQPMIPSPGHGSWPSGHATEAFLAATLIEALLDAATPCNGGAAREQLQRLAARIATNRVVAGVHFPVDSAVGRLLGTALTELLVARATGGETHERGFDGHDYEQANGAALDFSLHQPLDHGHGYSRATRGAAVGSAPLVAWLWSESVKEWA